MGRLPVVAANFAITADGKIATRRFSSSTFTSPADKRRMLDIRARHDAILVGAATLTSDQMTLRLPDEALQAARERLGLPPEPIRAIVSTSGHVDPEARVFRTGGTPPTLYVGNQIPAATHRRLSDLARVVVMPGPTVSPGAVLADLAKHHRARRVLCEGGPRLLRSLLAEGLLHTLFLTLAPRIFGGAKAPTLTGVLPGSAPRSLSARRVAMEIIGSECFLEYRLQKL